MPQKPKLFSNPKREGNRLKKVVFISFSLCQRGERAQKTGISNIEIRRYIYSRPQTLEWGNVNRRERRDFSGSIECAALGSWIGLHLLVGILFPGQIETLAPSA